MSNVDSRLKGVEVKTEEIRNDLNSLEEKMKDKTDENFVKVIVDEMIKENEVVTEEQVQSIIESKLRKNNYMTENDVKNITKDLHLLMIKWVIGLIISFGTITLGLLRIFMM